MSSHRCGSGGRVQTFTTGVLFLVGGMAVWAGARGWYSWRDTWAWWPLWLAIPGIYKLAAPAVERQVFAGLVWLSLAAVLIGMNLGYIDLRFRDLAPLVLVIIGVRLLYKGRRPGRTPS